MYYSIRGKLIQKTPDSAVIETAGTAYEIFVSATSYSGLPKRGDECRLYTYLYVREDIMQLFGFIDTEEKGLFLKLISLSGIGPKNAMNILSAISPYEFKKVILNGDITRLKALPGIGPKTAKRLLLELKEKMSDEELSDVIGGSGGEIESSRGKDALMALESLGYKRAEIQKKLESILSSDPEISTEELIRKVLKSLNSK